MQLDRRLLVALESNIGGPKSESGPIAAFVVCTVDECHLRDGGRAIRFEGEVGILPKKGVHLTLRMYRNLTEFKTYGAWKSNCTLQCGFESLVAIVVNVLGISVLSQVRVAMMTGGPVFAVALDEIERW